MLFIIEYRDIVNASWLCNGKLNTLHKHLKQALDAGSHAILATSAEARKPTQNYRSASNVIKAGLAAITSIMTSRLRFTMRI
jgi:hypothetical protein